MFTSRRHTVTFKMGYYLLLILALSYPGPLEICCSLLLLAYIMKCSTKVVGKELLYRLCFMFQLNLDTLHHLYYCNIELGLFPNWTMFARVLTSSVLAEYVWWNLLAFSFVPVDTRPESKHGYHINIYIPYIACFKTKHLFCLCLILLQLFFFFS